MNLKNEILKSKKEIKTDSYPMSIGELVNLYKEGDLIIYPEFQRYFRWNDKQKSDLIESIILDIPIPPIFVSNNSDGRWEIIDGLQRMSTILEFMGELKDRNRPDYTLPASTLLATKFLPSLEGKKWDDDSIEHALPVDIKRIIKRRSMNINIVDSTINPIIKYELFERLNRNGSILKGQEVRNSLLIMVNKELYYLLLYLSEIQIFREITNLPPKQLDEQYDKELIVRFLILLTKDISEVSAQLDMEEFLTDQLIDIATNITADEIKIIKEKFIITSELLYNLYSDKVFRKYDKKKDEFRGQFFLGLFEVIFTPVYKNIDFYIHHENDLKIKIKEVSNLEGFKEATRRGTRAIDRMKKLNKLGQEVFNEN